MVNIQDVARLAGVSISTVSRVMNNPAKVKVEVRKRIEIAMRELDYQPNPAARSLRTNRSRIFGLMISDIQNPFFTRLIQGVEDEAQRHDFSVILCNCNEDPRREQQYLEMLYLERVAGLIIVPVKEKLDETTTQKFKERGIPIVAVDRRVSNKDIDAILVDNIQGSYEAVTHLIDNGYRRIGVVTGPLNITTGLDRLSGYRRALKMAGISRDPALERSGPFSVETGFKLTSELLNLGKPIEALFVGNNLLTIGALEAINRHNLKVSRDIGLVGYDDTYWSGFSSVSLTTVTQPVNELGRTATLRLLQHLNKTSPKLSTVRQEIILPPALTIRDSSAPRRVVPQTQAAV